MVELYGLASDCHYERSRTIPHNGYNPVFDETFEFRIILPELALLRFVVLDDDHIGDCFIGQYTIPVNCIRQGMWSECYNVLSKFDFTTFVKLPGGCSRRKGCLKESV